jgi:aryl-alcohol dehydrogenase-like predicted oxidoreductase
LAALDEVSQNLSSKPATVALAWLLAQTAVTAPIVSATSRTQIDELVQAVELHLPSEAIAILNKASEA